MKSNITKNFQAKAKRGLCMAEGGLLDPQVSQPSASQPAAAPMYMDSLERENAEKTARWRQDDQLSRGIAPQAVAGLGGALQKSSQPSVSQPSASQPAAAPMYMDSLERENAEKTARWRQDDLLAGRGLRMAEGGMVPETAEQVMARMANKYGTTGAAQAAPVAQPVHVQVPQPAPQPKPAGGLFGRALGGLRQANEQLRQASNYAEGGIVRGKGGPTDDEVPMTIGGTDVNLSNKEAVLPAKTVDALGGPEAVEALIEETNGKPPVSKGLRQGGEYAGGNVYEVDPAGNVRSPGQIAGILPNPNPPPAVPQGNALEPSTRPNWVPGNNAPAPTTSVVPYQPVTVSPTPPLPQAPAPSMPYRAGQAVAGLAKQAWANKGKAVGPAGDALALYNANKVGTSQDAFSNDPNVPTIEKAKQFGRNAVKLGVPFAAGAVGAGMGTVASPTVVVNPLTGGVAGYGLGAAAVSGVDAEGQALTEWRKQQGADPMAQARPTNQAILNGDNKGKINLPAVDKAGAARGLADARASAEQDALQSNPNVEGLRSAGVNGDFRTLATGNGNVFAGRDTKGQLHVNSGMEKSLEQGDKDRDAQFTKAGYGKDAYGNWMTPERIGAKEQLRGLQYENNKFNATSDQITDPNARAAGLRGLAQYDAEEKQKAEVAKNAELAGLRRDQIKEHGLDRQERARQFDATQTDKKLLAQVAAREKGVTQMQTMLGKAGYKDQDAVDFEDFIYQNHADNLSGLSHAEQLKVLPRLKADFQDMKTRNLNSTNGTSWKNQKRVRTDKLDYETDAAIDPTGIVDNKVWFGDGSDGKGLGKANIFARKNLFTQLFGSDDVDVMEDGQRVMRKDNRGARGPHGTIQMNEINRLSLKDAAK